MTTETKNTKAFYNTEIPSDREVKKLYEIADVRDGTHESPKYFEHGVKFLTSKNIKDGELDFSDVSFITQEDAENFNKRSKVDKGDILMSMIGTIGNSVLVDFEPDFCIKNVGLIKPKNIDRYFLIQFYHSPIFQNYLARNLDGGIQKFVSLGGLRDIPIPLPPLPEQKAIAQVLSTADAAIYTTEKLIAQKELRKKWLMQQLLTGKKRLKGFGGEWKEKKLSDLFDRVTRKNTEGNTTVVTISAQRGFVRQTDFFKKNIASEITDNYFLVERGEFCYNKSYSNGYPWGATKRLKDFDKAVVTTLYICFGVKDEKKTNPEFFEQYFGANHLDKGLTKIAHEGGRAHGLLNVTPSDFFSLKVSIPSYEEQTAIAQVLQAADKEINLLKAKAEKLREQKKGLMQQLLTGKVRLM
jgi:type I restriction enzyme S subunit